MAAQRALPRLVERFTGDRRRSRPGRRLSAASLAALLVLGSPCGPAVSGTVAAPPGRAPAPQRPSAVPATAAGPAEPATALVARGDEAWERRADGGRADAGAIGEAVSAYDRALAAAPDDIAIRVRLLRALYFQGRFATGEGPARRAVYARGRDLAEQGIARVATELGDPSLDPRAPEAAAAALAARPESVALAFWAAAHWGLWGEAGGSLAAARQGVAGKVRDYAEIVIRLDERYEAGGGLRIRGRLHTEAPRIPLVTGWVDRDVAVRSLERAVELAPGEPLNRLYLAEALLRFRPRRRAEALALLDELLAATPRPGSAMEDEAAREDARRTLAGLTE